MTASRPEAPRPFPALNAIVTRLPAEAIEEQRAQVQARMDAGQPVGRLAGLRYGAKDVHRTKGLRTTFGSPLFEHHVPEQNDPLVERLLEHDAILIGKTNTPEFAAGSQTFNPIFGPTLNPYDPAKTVGGSSGGSAAAVACGELDIGDGSDLAASLRNPASFCGVVGMRPSSTLQPQAVPEPFSLGTLNQVGALTRDVALQREVWRALYQPLRRQSMAAWAQARADENAARLARFEHRPLRIAWTIDFEGRIPVEDAVRTSIEAALQQLARDPKVTLVQAAPDFSDADECFQILRGQYFVQWLGPLYRESRQRMKDTVVWNIEKGLAQTPEQIAWAERKRAEIHLRFARFIKDFDAFVLPTAQVLPFDASLSHPQSINGQALTTYVDWLKSCYWITVCGHPAISLPCGFSDTPRPLPVGLQWVGRFGADEDLLDVAQWAESRLQAP